MFCSNCGNNLPDDAKFCAACGTPVTSISENIVDETPQPETPQYEAPAYAASQPEEPQYKEPVYEVPQYEAPQTAPAYEVPQAAPAEGGNKVKEIISFVLGLCSLVFCWMGLAYFTPGIFPLGAGIAGLILSKGAVALGKKGKIFSLIGTIASGVFMFIGLFAFAAEL